ncbi:WD40 repeat domain-containing protein [Cytobacillus sp. FJAT-54145]|uniref:WD40 repeat domain-containing protein n=1 Tax=Cytobacillus spartinae TaxID=3299023 RepID=A0ABW6KBZ4_9BACI
MSFDFKKKYLNLAIPVVLTTQLFSPLNVLGDENPVEIETIELDDSQTPVEEEKNKPDLEVENLGEFHKVGPQVFHGTALTAAYGKSPEDVPYMYILQHGTPSALSIVNLVTGETEDTITLENSTSAWGIDVDSHQNVWIGGTSSGNLYKYDPVTKELTDFGNRLHHNRDTAILDLEVGGDRIYGSTAYNGTVFSYIPETGEQKDYGQVIKGKEFAKSVLYDEELESIFMGVGSKAELIRYDIRTKMRDRFLPWEYRFEKYVSDIQIVGDYLFARLDPSNKVIVMNKKTLELLDEIDVTSKTVSPKSPDQDVVYYTYEGQLFAYHYKSGDKIKVEIPNIGQEVISLDFVEMNTEDNPGATLVGLTSNAGEYFTYNLSTGHFSFNQADLTELPVTLYTLFTSPSKEQILINGYMSGGIGIYDIHTGKTTPIKDVSQIESMSYLNNKLYLGAYPKARLLEYDLNLPISEAKFKEITRYKDLGQERPTALLGIDELNKLVIGTYPETSTGGGLLSIYDPSTKEVQSYENYIENQSIISLSYLSDYVYGGTSVFANHVRSEEGATLFKFKADNPLEKEIIALPIKATMINSLIHQNGELLYGMADGKLFSYNVMTQETNQNEIVPAISGRFKNSTLLFGPNNLLYGTVEGVLFSADPESLEVKILKAEGAKDLAIDKNGDLYFRNEADLWKYEMKR